MVASSQKAFLRSINLVYDAASPECVEHFYPTAKAVILIETIMGANTSERLNFVVAPYGSGKSLAATYVLQVIENRVDAKDVLMRVAERMRTFAGDLSEQIIKRVNGHSPKREKGIVITLHGSVRNLSNSIKKSALDSILRLGLIDKAKHLDATNCQTIEDLQAFIRDLLIFSHSQKAGRVAFIWDEFGKHLETLIAEGRSTELIEIQQLAEICRRQEKTPVTLTLLMHQGLNNYAAGLPQSIRNEWSKVAGRFHEIRYVDNSKEIYQLIARIMSSDGLKQQNLINVEVPDQLQKLGLFKEFNKKELLQLLSDSRPLDAIGLYLLPRISARVAQNERTLFSFLNDLEDSQSIGTDALYDYFSNEMHADISVGGTSKQWLQAESAISQCDGDPIQVKAIKCACLLGMGLLGERTKVPEELLKLALCGYDTLRNRDASAIVKILIKKKLLLYRKYNDTISVWHGTDFDIRGKLEELKTSNREQFDVVGFLNKETPPRSWRPLRYNAEHRIHRYFSGVYAALHTLESYDILSLEIEGQYSDAKIIYFIPSDDSEIKKVQTWANRIQDHRVGIFIPYKPIALTETALEVFCLMELSRDQKIISQDPLLSIEIAQMIDDARSYLQQLTDRFTTPGEDVIIYFGGKKWDVRTEEAFNEKLSKLMEDTFHLTPVINNELIVRQNVSNPIKNARKKLVMGILEHGGEKPSLGFSDTEMRTPQASMYRSIFLHTGLYDANKEKPRFNQPEKINDKGMRHVWSEFKNFYSEVGERSFGDFIAKLQKPPYGVRAALLPLLLAAGYKAFARSVVLCGPSGYLNDLMSSTFEQICAAPALYTLRVINLTSAKDKYLSALAWLFFYGEESTNEQVAQADLNRNKELLRQVYEAFCKWRGELPVAALSADSVSKKASLFQQILKEPQIIPDDLFLTKLPLALGCSNPGADAIKAIAAVIQELTNVVSAYQKQVEQVICEAFSLSKGSSLGPLKTAASWVSCFPDDFKSSVPDLVARRIFSLVQDYTDSDERFVDELALIFVGKGVIHWDTSTFNRFSEKLNELIAKMQRMIFQNPSAKGLNKGVQYLLKAEAERLKLKMIDFGFSEEEIKKIFFKK
ncbi:MAG: hypothetical protein WAW22_07725 [Smithellaceae bacterium]